MDRHGVIGTAEVLVGIAAPNEANQAPCAVDDTVEVRPTARCRSLLENDTDSRATRWVARRRQG